jgi:flagellar biosynthesis protein FlhB
MAEDKASKTEEPTARRLSKAREGGQVPKSIEVNTVAVLLTALFVLFLSGSFIYTQLSQMMIKTLSQAGQGSIEDGALFPFLLHKLQEMMIVLAPVFAAVFVVALFVNFVQVGVLFTLKPLEPKLSKINPISGLSKLFSKRSLMELFKSIGKIVIVGFIAYWVVRSKMDMFLVLGDMAVGRIARFVLAVSFEIFLKTCWALIALSIIDLIFQKWQHHQEMKMTKEEVKEEHKQSEGDPLVKSRIRSAQRDAARKRMMADVPKADVVVTNPVHLALALLYDPEQSDAPMVVAKGQALIAERIKAIAREHDIPIMENKPLARALYKSVSIGQTIPAAFYQAVAEILAYVYRLKGKSVHGSARR